MILTLMGSFQRQENRKGPHTFMFLFNAADKVSKVEGYYKHQTFKLAKVQHFPLLWLIS